jgi:hypothetical protein
LIILYLGPNPLPPDYIPIRPAVLLILTSALFAIYGISIALSTLLLRRSISIFEIAQAIIAFALATISILRTNQGAATIIGAFCLLLAGACYLAALARFDHISQTRNYHVFASWAAVLMLIGSFLIFPATIAGLFFSAAAILGTFFGVRSSRWTLAFHGALYLAMAGYFSGLWGYSAGALAGPLAPPSGWGLWTTVLSALLCCAMIWWERECSAQRIRSLLRLIFSSSATYAATALALAGVVWIISSSLAAGTPVLAVVRTLVLCLVIVGLSFSGAKWHRAELIWIAYAAIAFCTLKLLFEDLRYGTTASLATSLFFYGTIWVLVPRFVRSGAR